jgi:hypothetical protein
MYYESLNQKTKKIWDRCAFLHNDFYLAGGTALALQIGHRISVDLDFFSFNPIKKTLLTKVEAELGNASVLVNTKNELTLLVSEIKISFIHYPFPLKEKAVGTNMVPLASILDIASMKAYTMGRRRSFKDYVDLYYIISKNITSLDIIISNTKEIYKEGFNDRLFCEQLISPEDLNDEAIIWLSEKQSKSNMQSFLKERVKEFLKK